MLLHDALKNVVQVWVALAHQSEHHAQGGNQKADGR